MKTLKQYVENYIGNYIENHTNESILDDEDEIINDDSYGIEAMKNDIIDLIMNHKTIDGRMINKKYSSYRQGVLVPRGIEVFYDKNTKFLILNTASNAYPLFIPILSLLELLKNNGFSISGIESKNKIVLDNAKNRAPLENFTIKCNGVKFRGFDVIKNVTYQSNDNERIGLGESNLISILDTIPVKLENFKYITNINKRPLPHRLNDVTYRNQQIKAHKLYISDINNIELNKPIKNITNLDLGDAGLGQKNGIIDVLSKHFIPGVACFDDMTTGKTIIANNLKKYFSMLKNYKRYSLKEHVRIFDCDFRDVLKFPDLQIITSGDCWSYYRLVVYCNDQEDWDVEILRK